MWACPSVPSQNEADPGAVAARCNWGRNWRIPTSEELAELRTKCVWTWEGRNGKNGYKVTGANGNKIFLPAAGVWSGTSQSHTGTLGLYWSSSLHLDNAVGAENMVFTFDRFDGNSFFRYCGLSVRPVTE